jgi:mannose-6-phosphate isomerase-like protein (cupin superfamily)
MLKKPGFVKGKRSRKPIGEGTVVFIASGEEHCFTNMGSDVLRFICVIPVTETATPKCECC